jgi:myosin heavy subunit
MIVPGSICLAYHPQHAWVPGTVEDFDGKVGVVSVTQPKKQTISKLKEDDIFICDEAAMNEDVDDLLNLAVLHDGTLLACLRQRYLKNIVYTNIGAIVVALNPFNYKIPWYMDDKMGQYLAEGDTIQENLPHSWAVAHNTYYEMRADSGNQCILVSGESGAGKTEASKIVMKYLGAVSGLSATSEDEKKAGQLVGLKMMQSNPILEAFGNAKTVRNDNSSRFGKLMRIKFNEKGVLTGADVTKYLLEKSRILTSAPDERCYHSFYLLLKGKDRESFGLNPIADYKTVNAGKAPNVPGMDDTEDYMLVNEAMTTCGVEDSDRNSIWRTLAGILTFQQVNFEPLDGGDKCQLAAGCAPLLDNVCAYWGVDAVILDKELRTTTLIINKQKVLREMNVVKAIDARDSLCKHTYDQVFASLVTTINKTIDTDDEASWIALLDIFGFEDFKLNSFEQVCINLTNETLQGHYNSFIFVRDMEECRAEGIDTTDIKFPDNTPCIDMVSAKGGILSILDEECVLGQASDLTFLDKINQRFGKNPFYDQPRLAKVPSFRIHHYAGTVTYDVENFLEKNRDTLKDNLKLMMRASSDPFVAQLLPAPVEGSKYTVGGFFKTQLKQLMVLINSTNPHWIRCIKPHPAKKPLMFDGVQTLNQLRSSGVLGTVQIRKAGYPIRIKHADFLRKYRVLAVCVDPSVKKVEDICSGILKVCEFGMAMGQIGKTRVFLKSDAYQQMEGIKKRKLQVFANSAVAAAHTALARQRTAAFLRLAYVRTVQAFMHSIASQRLFREKDYAIRKDSIIAHVRLLLKLQKDEEMRREDHAAGFAKMQDTLRVLEQESLSKLEAQWWSEKPDRDEKQAVLLMEKEQAARMLIEDSLSDALDDLLLDMEDDRVEAQQREEDREEEERQDELVRLAEEEERLQAEAIQREEEDRANEEQRREEQRRIAIYYWNKQKKEAGENERRKREEDATKTKWMRECAEQTRQSLQLMKEEKYLQLRERAQYPAPRFMTAKHTSLLYADPNAGRSPPPAPPRDDQSDDGSNRGMSLRETGIGGLNPMLVNPAEEKSRMSQARLAPSYTGSLSTVQRLRKLQTIKDSTVIRTPLLQTDDVRNPMNPMNPDWAPPSNDVIVLPDGTQLNVANCEIPEEKAVKRKSRRRARTFVDRD